MCELVHSYEKGMPVSATRYESVLKLATEVITLERNTLITLWSEGKISFQVKKRLLERLDLREKRYQV